MRYWLFKTTRQTVYPDVHGVEYVYDNRHSVRVSAGDLFIYLDTSRRYSFTGMGRVQKVAQRQPAATEAARTEKVRVIFAAHLADFVEFRVPVSISPATKEGRTNRAKLGIVDANLLGWSQSIPHISEAWFNAILDLAQAERAIPTVPPTAGDYSVPDTWAKTKIRQAASHFTEEILSRHGGACVVCGSKVEGLIDAVHLSPWASDERNRANPANGLCLCPYCHRALDRRLIAIAPDGRLLVAEGIGDPIASAHFTAVDARTRREWLAGVGSDFLELTVRWFVEAGHSAKASASEV